MGKARFTQPDEAFTLQAASSIDAGQVIQLPTGEAAFLDSGGSVSSGAYTRNFRTRGKATVEKTTSVVFLPGQEVYWDRSAGKAHYAKVNDRDFFLGLATAGAASADISMEVDLNKRGRFCIDLARDFFLQTLVGTVSYNTMGSFPRGGGYSWLLSSTNEAQKIDFLSVDGFDPSANAIVEAVFRVVSDGAGTAPDFNIGVANATHASDADSIAESFFVHLDGNDVNIYAESDDGTNEVAATDTTIDYTEGTAVTTRVHVLFDLRDLADLQLYINGANVLPATTFRLDNATGPLKLLAHLEKTAALDTYHADIEQLRCWLAEQ